MTDIQYELNASLGYYIRSRSTITIEPATVIAVDLEALTCDVIDPDGIELYDVRLRAAVDGQDTGLVLVPALDSQVLIGNIGNSPNAWAVIATTELQAFTVSVDGVSIELKNGKLALTKDFAKIELNASGILIERNSQSLRSALVALLEQLKVLTVTSSAPGTPSSIPLNAPAFEIIKTQIETILR